MKISKETLDVLLEQGYTSLDNACNWNNLRLTFDGESHKLISAEVLS